MHNLRHALPRLEFQIAFQTYWGGMKEAPEVQTHSDTGTPPQVLNCSLNNNNALLEEDTEKRSE